MGRMKVRLMVMKKRSGFIIKCCGVKSCSKSSSSLNTALKAKKNILWTSGYVINNVLDNIDSLGFNGEVP